jgi:soluble P-type ATPase
METTSVKSEILNDLKELKQKGVNVLIHDSFLDRGIHFGGSGTMVINSGSFTINGGPCVSGEISEEKVKVLKRASELTVHIYLNSKEEEIKAQISGIKGHLNKIESESKSSAIVDFLKEELNK